MEKLTKGESEVMQLLWQAERATVSDLLEKMGDSRPPHSTISSVVRILEKKGFVGYKAYGKTHEYFPLISRDDYARGALTEVVRDFFDGSAQRLVSHLLENRQISESDLADMLRTLENLED